MVDPQAIVEELRSVADPCCRERGISVVDMGLVHEITVADGEADVGLLLTSGWCPFQVDLVREVAAAAERVPGVTRASVRIVLDDVWSTARMAPEARGKLRFLPEPAAVADPDAYRAQRLPQALPQVPAQAPSAGPERQQRSHDDR